MRKRTITVLLLASLVGVIVFWMGFVMGKEINKQNILTALKNDDTRQALFIWHKMKEDGVEVTKNPLFFLTFAKSFAKKGDMEAVQFNLNKVIDLLGAK